MSAPAVNDHYRPTAAEHPAGTYRVVGTPDGTVTLLRVGDADGTRVHTGDLTHVDSEAFDGFEPTKPPTRRSLGTRLSSAARTGYWSVRSFVRSAAARPIISVAALAAMVAGVAGETVLGDVLATALLLAGSFVLAAAGSGRL